MEPTNGQSYHRNHLRVKLNKTGRVFLRGNRGLNNFHKVGWTDQVISGKRVRREFAKTKIGGLRGGGGGFGYGTGHQLGDKGGGGGGGVQNGKRGASEVSPLQKRVCR